MISLNVSSSLQSTDPVFNHSNAVSGTNSNLLFSQIQPSIQTNLVTASYPISQTSSNSHAGVDETTAELSNNTNSYMNTNTVLQLSSAAATTTTTANSMLTNEPVPCHQQNENIDLSRQAISVNRQAALDIDHPNRTAYLNSIFSNIVELPLTPSPPALLEADENSEYENGSNAVSTTNDDEIPRIPISHLVTTNQYPSLTKIPPPNIAQSYPPLYVQPQNYQQSRQNAAQTEEIYSDYVNNPYNLTLDVDHEQSLYHTETAASALQSDNLPSSHNAVSSNSLEQTQNSPNKQQPQQIQSNIFQSANYFGIADDNIPPGSEMLFGSP